MEDEKATLVLFGSIRWEMNMHRNIEHSQLNRKQQKKRRNIQTHQSGWVTSAMKINTGQQAQSTKKSGGFNGNQAMNRCASLGVIVGAPPCTKFFLGSHMVNHQGIWGLRACLVLTQPYFFTHPSALFQMKTARSNVADFSLAYSGVAMETGLSHPPLIESSLGGGGGGGGRRKMSKWNSILPKYCLKLKSSVSQPSLPHSPDHTQAAAEVGGAALRR